jgi:hypothetical protein
MSTSELDCFVSSFARDRPPRGLEQRSVLIQMGISFFETAGQAAAVALRYPKIGNFVARVELPLGHGICYADTGPPGHLTIWGRPLQLADAIADVRAVSAHA